jgi:hypothetical protein
MYDRRPQIDASRSVGPDSFCEVVLERLCSDAIPKKSAYELRSGVREVASSEKGFILEMPQGPSVGVESYAAPRWRHGQSLNMDKSIPGSDSGICPAAVPSSHSMGLGQKSPLPVLYVQ